MPGSIHARSYHVYRDIWVAAVWEVLPCEQEPCGTRYRDICVAAVGEVHHVNKSLEPQGTEVQYTVAAIINIFVKII